MASEHVLGIIDGGDVLEVSRAERAAAFHHLRGCATCARAWEAANVLTKDLADLPRPSPPPDLARDVLARIVRLEDGQPPADAAAPSASGARNWSAWLTAAGGLAIAAAIFAIPSVGPVPIGIPSVTTRGAALVHAMSSTAVWAPLLVGLVLYVVGLLGPVSSKDLS